MQLKIDKKDRIEIFENAISWVVVFAMFVYGGAKYFQFRGATAVNKTVSEMTGMEIMWAFYGYSHYFAITLGIFEIIGGILLLIKKTRILGCLFTSTILLNIILQDIYYEVHLGALRAAILYQFLIGIILWINRIKVREAMQVLLSSSKTDDSNGKLVVKIGFALLLFILFRIGEYYLTIKI